MSVHPDHFVLEDFPLPAAFTPPHRKRYEAELNRTWPLHLSPREDASTGAAAATSFSFPPPYSPSSPIHSPASKRIRLLEDNAKQLHERIERLERIIQAGAYGKLGPLEVPPPPAAAPPPPLAPPSSAPPPAAAPIPRARTLFPEAHEEEGSLRLFFCLAAHEWVPAFYTRVGSKVYVEPSIVAYVVSMFDMDSTEGLEYVRDVQDVLSQLPEREMEVLKSNDIVPKEVPIRTSKTSGGVFAIDADFWAHQVALARASKMYADLVPTIVPRESLPGNSKRMKPFNLPGEETFDSTRAVPTDLFPRELSYFKTSHRDHGRFPLNKFGWLKVIIENEDDRNAVLEGRWDDICHVEIPSRINISQTCFVYKPQGADHIRGQTLISPTPMYQRNLVPLPIRNRKFYVMVKNK